MGQSDDRTLCVDNSVHWDGTAWQVVADLNDGLSVDSSFDFKSPDAPNMQRDFEFVSATEIYAVLGQQICLWNGTAWTIVTPDAPSPLHELCACSPDVSRNWARWDHRPLDSNFMTEPPLDRA